MKLVFVRNDKIVLGILAKIFTRKAIYHLGWRDEEHFYDMHLNRRRRYWSDVKRRYEKEGSNLLEFDVPQVQKSYLEHMLSREYNVYYGFLDYLMFGLRPIYHFFGKSTRNMHGEICSESVNNDLLNSGIKTDWDENTSPPSPTNLYLFFIEQEKTNV
jgi:hypothetical protein